jgi:hypothetical protein
VQRQRLVAERFSSFGGCRPADVASNRHHSLLNTSHSFSANE